MKDVDVAPSIIREGDGLIGIPNLEDEVEAFSRGVLGTVDKKFRTRATND